MSLTQKLSVGGRIALGIATLAELWFLAGCSAKSTLIIDQRNLSGMTVATYADQYCGFNANNIPVADRGYNHVVVNQVERSNGDKRYELAAINAEGMDYSCNSSWIKP